MDNQQASNPLASPPADTSVHVGSDIPKGSNPIWQVFKSSKLLKIGLPLLLVALLPVVVLLAQERQTNQSRASAATVLSLTPASAQTTPAQLAVGEYITLNIEVDPGTNLLSNLQLDITYDKEVLELENQSDFVINTDAFPTPLGNPSFSPGKILITMSVGPDASRAIKTKTRVGTIKLKAINGVKENKPTLVTFGPNTKALSIGANDFFSENVLSSAQGVQVAILGGAESVPVGSPGNSSVNVKQNPNMGIVRGEYLDARENPLTLPNMQAVLAHQGQKAGTVNKSAPVFTYNNVKPGKYRLQIAPISGYNTLISVCEKRCKDAKPQYKREYSVNFEVTPKRAVHIGVKYVPNGTLQSTPTTSVAVSPTLTPTTTGASVQNVCNGSTADVNKDGRVDNADQTIATNCRNKDLSSNPHCAASDIDKSGAVDVFDLNCILRGGQ